MSDSSIPSDDDLEAFLGDITLVDSGDDGFTATAIEDEGVPPVKDPTDITSGFEDSTISIGDGECSVCGAPTFRPPGLTKTGRKKRAPKYCDIHDPKRKVSNAGSFATPVEAQLKRVQDELADDLRLLGMLAGPMLPVTGYYVFEHADSFTTAILKLAKNNPNVLRVLHRVAQVAPVYQVAETVAGTAYAIQVDMQKQDPHTIIAQRLGVSRAYDNVYPDSVATNAATNGSGGPPRYAQPR